MDALERMAKVVDQQNAGEPGYEPMSDNLESSVAFQAACDLVFKGRDEASGYTEGILTLRRRQYTAEHTPTALES
jgi:malate synthase